MREVMIGPNSSRIKDSTCLQQQVPHDLSGLMTEKSLKMFGEKDHWMSEIRAQ